MRLNHKASVSLAAAISASLLLSSYFVVANAAEDEGGETMQAKEIAKALADPTIVSTGQRLFVLCQGCHMIGENAQRRVGPPLNGVVGRGAAKSDGYPYSPAMQAAAENGLVWTVDNLDSYLKSPREVVPATTMGFAGTPKPQDRKALIAYLASYAADGSRIEAAHD